MRAVAVLRWVVLAVAVAMAAPAYATPAGMRRAIEAMDLDALRTEAATGTEAERRLARAIELSWRGDDEAAVSALNGVIPQLANRRLQAAGYWALSSVHARQGNFAAATKAGTAAVNLAPANASSLQAMKFMEALIGVEPTRAAGEGRGRAEIKRDVAGLIRSDIVVGGVSLGAVLDTGANYSTITESAAQRMGLRMLEGEVSVGSSSRAAVASRIGVAEKLAIGGADFTSVVFIVLPDLDLTFAGGAYRIDAILGMPVFFEMGRIELMKEVDKEWFVFGRAEASPAEAEPNILLSGMSPLVLADVLVDGAHKEVRLLLDSGAQKSSLDGRFEEDFAFLLRNAPEAETIFGGAGGVVFRTAKKLGQLDLRIGGAERTLKGLDVHTGKREDRHGLLGMDALNDGFVIDFDAGRLELR